MLEWVAWPSSRGSSRPRDQTHTFYISCVSRAGRRALHHRCRLGSPCAIMIRLKVCVYQKLCFPCASPRTFRSFLCITDAAPQPPEAEGIKRRNNQTLDLSLPKPCVLRQAPSVCPLLPGLKVVSVTWTSER